MAEEEEFAGVHRAQRARGSSEPLEQVPRPKASLILDASTSSKLLEMFLLAKGSKPRLSHPAALRKGMQMGSDSTQQLHSSLVLHCYLINTSLLFHYCYITTAFLLHYYCISTALLPCYFHNVYESLLLPNTSKYFQIIWSLILLIVLFTFEKIQIYTELLLPIASSLLLWYHHYYHYYL